MTVKNAKFTPEILSCNESGYVLISVKNNNKDTFDKVAIKYTIKGSDGSVIAEKEDTVSYLLAGKTAYTSVYVGSSNLENVSGKLYTMIYDADNHLIGVESSSLYLNKQETKTLTYGYISKRSYPTYDHMELVVQAYYATNK